MQREYSEAVPELMDLPNLDERALRSDLLHLARLNRTFGGRKAVETVFHRLADKGRKLVLIDLASGEPDGAKLLFGKQRKLIAVVGRGGLVGLAVGHQSHGLHGLRRHGKRRLT